MNSTVKVKTRTGGEYFFKYADLSECKAAAKRPLAENGLAVTQLIEDDYSLLTMLVHSSGQWISSRVKMPIMESGAQAIGSAITYAKRYAFCAILGIVADDDEDGNLSQGNLAQKKDTKAPVKAPARTGKPAFNPQTMEREGFFDKIYGYEKSAKDKGEAFSLKAFIDSVYQIDTKAFKLLEEKYNEYKINNSL